ncbi:MAG: glycosyltransferase family 4 protein [Deltaproteobacteria bacterium]|nr:glycosyltransferase family 4 protein [Deltaproteobacteria bacterium]
MTADTLGGVWTYALELAAALRDYGIEVALATMGLPLSPEQRKEVHKIPNLNLFESRYKLEWMEDPWEDVSRAGEWLLELEREIQPDLVHLNGYAHGVLPWKAPVLLVGHSCVLSWWTAVKGGAAPTIWDRYRREIGGGLAAADQVAAPTRHMLEALRRHYGPLPGGKVIYNGRSPFLFPPGKKENFVLAVGRLWDKAKNLSAICQIASALPWPVYVAGEKKHPEGSEVPAEAVHFLGFLSPSALAEWYARAAIYILPARYEPFGLSALEAGLAGCALVLGDIPSLREVWGEAAAFVHPEDREALRCLVAGLIADPARRRRLAALARERALIFSPQRMAAGYVEIYRELLEGGSREPREQGGNEPGNG